MCRDLSERSVDKNVQQDLLALAVPDDSGSPEAEGKIFRIGERSRIGREIGLDGPEFVDLVGGRDSHGIAAIAAVDRRLQLVNEPGRPIHRQPKPPSGNIDCRGPASNLA